MCKVWSAGQKGVRSRKCIARICREAGGTRWDKLETWTSLSKVQLLAFAGRLEERVGTTRDMDLPALATDSRRLEVVDGRQLWCARCIVIPFRRCSQQGRGGSRVGFTERRKERQNPELVGPWSRARLVVLAVEVGGRWSAETVPFWPQLAKAKSRETLLFQKRAEQAWLVLATSLPIIGTMGWRPRLGSS